jgi:hypothetical protein
MKVAINRCFGGFSLSDEAFERILHRKGVAFYVVTSYYSKTYYYKTTPEQQDREEDNDEEKKEEKEKEHMNYISKYEYYENRADSDLIAVIEEMQGKANGANGVCAKLAIVEIPDDVKWHIEEYDGNEHVAEDHRTWY